MKRLIGALLVLCAVPSLWAGAAPQKDRLLRYENQKWAWVTEKWDGDNAPFAREASSIRARIAAGEGLDKAYDAYVAAAAKNPRSPLAQFSRTYFLVSASWGRSLDLAKRRTSPSSELLDAWRGLVAVDSPRCREFSRLRFLISCREGPMLELTPMGKRLYESDKSDEWAKYFYVRLLNFSEDGKVLRQALQMAKEIQAAKPSDSSVNGLLASSYSSLWLAERDKRNALLSIQFYEKSVLYSKDEEWRKWGKHLISVLKQEIKQAGG